MKQILKENISALVNSTRESISQFARLNIILMLFSIILSTCSAQVTPPVIQNLSFIQTSNTRSLKMQIPTQAGVNYIAQFRSRVGTGSWSLFTNFPGTGAAQVFSNTAGNISARFYRVSADPRPWIRGEPLSKDPYAGETVQLDVLATGMLPLSYQWYGPDGILSNGGQISGCTTPNLVIVNVDPGNEGNYWATVTNQYGNTSSIPAGVRITLSQAPRILIDPQGQTLTEKQNLALTSSASGAATLRFKWFGPAGVLSDGGRVSGSESLNLTISNLQLADDGGYYMVVSNAFGAATSAIAKVVVQPGIAPRITTDPLSQTVNAGQTVNLQVVANGTPTLVYRWNGPSGVLNNGGRISGATTANLAISNFQISDNGNYFAVVTNSFGAATSVSANVTAQ